MGRWPHRGMSLGGGNLGGAKKAPRAAPLLSLPANQKQGPGLSGPTPGAWRGGAPPRTACSGCLSAGAPLVRGAARLEGSWAAELVQRPPSLCGPRREGSPGTPSAVPADPLREMGTGTQTRGWEQSLLSRHPPPHLLPPARKPRGPQLADRAHQHPHPPCTGPVPQVCPPAPPAPGVVPPETKWVSVQPPRTHKLSLVRFVTKKALPMGWETSRGSPPPTGIQFVGNPDRRALPPPPKLSETTARTPGRSDARTLGRTDEGSPSRRRRRDPRAVTRAGAAAGGWQGRGRAPGGARGRVGRRGGATF